MMISDAFFHADFWYRTEFDAPPAGAGRKQWLNFDGINWNADVFLNGEKARPHRGRVHARALRRDVAPASPERPTRWRCAIEKNATPGSVKEKTFEHPDKNGGGARCRQPHLSRLDRLGLDPDDPRPQHGHLERRVPHPQRPRSPSSIPSVTSTLPLPRHDERRRAHHGRTAQPRRRGRVGHAARTVRRRGLQRASDRAGRTARRP